MSHSELPAAVFIMGPTASGKTQLSIKLAKQLDAEIISVDSALVYKGMDIGTAKPDSQERDGIAHHLIDILDPAESFSTGQFRILAQQLISDISERGKLPVLVGGTMLYFNALLRGLADLPAANAEVRKQLDQEFAQSGKAAMHQKLQQIDPVAAARIHPNDPQRIQRALEIFAVTGKTITSFLQESGNQEKKYRSIKIILAPENRLALHEKIAQRFRGMLNQGLIDEVESLYQRPDLNESLPSIRAVGYRQVWSYLKGEYDYSMMEEKGIIATRQLAKRQFTWLRKENDGLIIHDDNQDLYPSTLDFITDRI